MATAAMVPLAVPDLTQHIRGWVCMLQVCLLQSDSSGRKGVTHHLIFLELLSLRLASCITDAETERGPTSWSSKLQSLSTGGYNSLKNMF